VNDNHRKYYLEHSDLLSEEEKLQMARDLRALERRGILAYRDGFWELAAGVELEETPDGVVARFPKQEAAVESHCAKNSTPSSGEPSETRVPPLTKAARSSAESPSSPDSTPPDADWEAR
jgi:hypothetical protein